MKFTAVFLALSLFSPATLSLAPVAEEPDFDWDLVNTYKRAITAIDLDCHALKGAVNAYTSGTGSAVLNALDTLQATIVASTITIEPLRQMTDGETATVFTQDMYDLSYAANEAHKALVAKAPTFTANGRDDEVLAKIEMVRTPADRMTEVFLGKVSDMFAENAVPGLLEAMEGYFQAVVEAYS